MTETIPLSAEIGPLLFGLGRARPRFDPAAVRTPNRAGAGEMVDSMSVTTPAPDLFQSYIKSIALTQDRIAFAALFNHFAPRVKSYLIRLGAPSLLAEDLAQETLLTVWRKANYYDPSKAAASSWVFAIARNLRIDALRRERNPVAIDWALDAQPDPTPLQDAILDLEEQSQLLNEVMRTLPAEQAEVVRLSYFLDKPHSQIEQELGIPLGTVKSRLRLALARLRAQMESKQ